MKRNSTERTKLEEVIPLDTPFVVHIETNNVCNFKCKFCPTGDFELLKKYDVKKGFMEYEIFCKIIDDLSCFSKKIKSVLFHISGEPLLHNRLPEMIKYARQRCIGEKLILFTNGSLLTPKLSREIIESGIDIIQVSIEGVSDKAYEELAGVKLSYDNLLANVAYLNAQRTSNCELIVKIIDCGLSEEEKEKFYIDFNKICSESHIENVVSYISEDIKDTSLGLNKQVTTDGYLSRDKEVCTGPFYTMGINFDGSVSACTCDWRQALIMGNVKENSLMNIWNGTKFNEFRKMQLRKLRKKHPACGECKIPYNQLDDIDCYSENILKRFKRI